jgi:hypothetical protein
MQSKNQRGFLIFCYLRGNEHRIRKYFVGIREEILAQLHAIIDWIAAGASALSGCFAYRRACDS